jgi:LPXTG-site transpeptidase (sortase) family protein
MLEINSRSIIQILLGRHPWSELFVLILALAVFSFFPSVNAREVGNAQNLSVQYNLPKPVPTDSAPLSETTALPKPARSTQTADTISIPKINVFAPIVTAKTSDLTQLHALLDLGAVLYPASAVFGTVGQTILLGHSAPSDWPKIKHDTLFSRLNELAPGDMIRVHYAGQTYDYLIDSSQIIEKGANSDQIRDSTSALILLTCFPAGHDQKRLEVVAKLAAVGQN